MWQRFTERARRIILLGQEEAGQMRSGHVGTEHLLLGLVRENEGVAAQVLQKMGVSLSRVRAEIEAEVQPGSDAGSTEPKLTSKAKRVLELAADEARRMRHDYIGTEHLLLALLREKDGLAATVLRRLGLNLEKARAQVMEYLGTEAPQNDPPHRAPRIDEEALTASSGGKAVFYNDSSLEGQIVRDLAAFVNNLNSGLAFPESFKFVSGARRGYFGANEWARNWNKERLQHQIRLRDINIKISGEAAEVDVAYWVNSTPPNKTPFLNEMYERGWTEAVQMKLSSGREGERQWQIVPLPQFPSPETNPQFSFLNQAAFALAQKETPDNALDIAPQSLMKLKLLCLAALQFAYNWDSNFAFSAPYLQEALHPYVASREFFTIPGTSEFYAFNDHLSGRNLNEISQPDQTVLFYEGESENLVFRYEGKAAVATVDGGCILVAPDEVNQLIWKP